ncbi:hypothetical protein GQ457_01G051150 [Hibiscus cannabinus]
MFLVINHNFLNRKISDGATIGSHGEAGIGGCLRDLGSKCLIIFSKSAGIVDCTSAEILAIFEACSLFRKSPWAKDYRLIIETDSSLAADWMLNPLRCPNVFKPLIEACLKECSVLDWRVSRVPRVCNSLADSLAKKAGSLILLLEVACGVFYSRFLYYILWCTLFPPI